MLHCGSPVFMSTAKIFIVSVCSVTMVLLGCQPRSEPELVWSDEFDYYGSPDPAKWDYDVGDGCPDLCGWGNQELQYYTRDLRNTRVENGILIIEARYEPANVHPYTSARLVTRGKAHWQYGRIEVRARLPRGKGTWPAIWMLPAEQRYGGWPSGGEIDIMEHVGFDEDVVHGTLHAEAYNHLIQTQREGVNRVQGATQKFYTYAIDWSEQKITFSVDGKDYYSVSRLPSDTWRQWPYDQPFYLILNVAVGGSWGGMKGIDEEIFPQRMEIDYVRIYAHSRPR